MQTKPLVMNLQLLQRFQGPNEEPQIQIGTRKRKQANIAGYIPQKMTMDVQKKIDNSLMKIFYKDFQPFSVVEDKGFSEFVKALNPSYKLPNRRSISATHIPSLHQKCLQETKELLANELISACLTTDCWTSRSNAGYIAITIHFIDTTFKLRSVLLGCLNFNDHHTSHNLSTKIEETLINWNLQNKIIFAVSDNANNIKRALTLLQLRNFGCFAHTMNLIVQSALTLEKDLIEKVKNIVSRFRRSTNASQKLLTCQIINLSN